MGRYTCLAHTPGCLGSQSPTCIFLLGCGGCALLLLMRKIQSYLFLRCTPPVGRRWAFQRGTGRGRWCLQRCRGRQVHNEHFCKGRWKDHHTGSQRMGPRCNQPGICSHILQPSPEWSTVKISIDYFRSYLADGISSTWVSKTFVLVRNALNTGVAHIIWRTSTLLPMSDALALGVDTTGVGKQT